MKKLLILTLFALISASSFSQLALKAGFGQELGWLGGAAEYKFYHMSFGAGLGLYDPDTKLAGWEIFTTMYSKGTKYAYENSPFLTLGYGVFGNDASKTLDGDYRINEVYYAFYGMAGYRAWFERVSFQIGAGIARNVTIDDSGLDFVFSVSLGYQFWR